MSTQFRGIPVRWFLAGVLVSLALRGMPLGAQTHEMQSLKKATAGGTYTNLLAVISMPGDRAEYGDFKDYGAYDATEWGHYKGLPKGNWVYVYPHWYIWQKTGKEGDALPLLQASVGGKYSQLLAVIHMPGDAAENGEFKDYGPYDSREWGGYKGLPKGNWVYVYPRWYIWAR